MQVGILVADSNGCYPVPASQGGAVSILVEHLVELNNTAQLIRMDVIAFYEQKAEELARSYPNIHFIWIKPPKIIKLFDRIIFNFIRFFRKKKKAFSYKSLISLLFYILKAKKLLEINNYDKLVIENNIPLAWVIKLSKYKGDYYYHLHNVPRIHAYCKDIFQKCTGILCVSQYVAEQIISGQNPIGPIEKKKIIILYNCINTRLFYKKNTTEKLMEIRNRYGLRKNACIILFVGRLSEEKGIDKLLEAMQYVKHDNVEVLIVGSYIHNVNLKDEYQKKIYLLADKLGKQIIFTGYVSQNELPDLYNVADVAVLPSMWDEPAGLTMVESMSCGVPVITTNSGGISEYVNDCGIILDRTCDLPKQIALNIDDLLINDAKRCQLSKKGMERVKDYFSLENYLTNFCKAIGD